VEINIMKKHFIDIDFRFLLFLILLTQGNLFIKPLAFLLILLSTPRFPYKLNYKYFGFFYFAMLLYSLFSIISVFWNLNGLYFIVFAAGILLWTAALLAFQYVYHFVQQNGARNIETTIMAFFKINMAVCIWQLAQLILSFGGNPYRDMSSGDYVIGIFSNSSVNMIINSLFVCFFFYRKFYGWAFLAFLLCLATTFMSGLVILFAVIAYFIFISTRIKVKHRITLAILSVIVFAIFALTSPSNIRYASDILGTLTKENRPRKVTSFIQTAEYMAKSPGNFMFGSGMGNFSSRLAFIFGGEYVAWYPKSMAYLGPDFKRNHFRLWNSESTFDRTQRGTSNQPFSVYNQMLGEYGVVGFGIFLVAYLGVFVRNYPRLTYSRMLFLLLIGYFILDYWLEYYSITVVLEFLVLYDLKNAGELGPPGPSKT
jgi:hypothetical protein